MLERWYEAAAPAWAATTLREARSLIDHHLIPNLGHLWVKKLTPQDIDSFYGYLLKQGGRDDKPLAPGTVHRVHVVLHRALAQATRWDWIWSNPATKASPPRALPAEIKPPSPEVVAKLLAHVSETNPAFHVFLMLAATTEARRGELSALRWNDVDLTVGAISFQRSLIEGPDGPVLAPTKTRRSHRVALDAQTAEVLRTYSDLQEPEDAGDREIVLFSRRMARGPTLASESCHQAVYPFSQGRRASTFSPARPWSFHGDPDARCWSTCDRGLSASCSCPRIDNA